jgi:hypothetical protein
MNPPNQPKPQSGTAPAASASGRKPWVKKSPVEVFLDQIKKQEEKVAGMKAELQREERELAKLQQARKVLESA